MKLVDEASAWVNENGVYVKLPEPLEADKKWIVRSALQKAIRRGQTDEALRLGFLLYVIDENYLWFSLLTVANEDVGFGSADAVTWAHLSQLKTFRMKVGELPLISALIVDMCNAPKSRSNCELSWLVDTQAKEALLEAGRMSTAELIEWVKGKDAGKCYAALAVLKGMLPSGLKIRKPDPHGVQLACEVMAEQLDAGHARAAQHALLRPQDNMSIASFPAFRLALEAEDPSIVEDPFLPSKTVAGFASEAYDTHTSEGKRAIKGFHTQLYKVYDEIQELPSKVGYAALQDAVFIEEGTQLDRWVTSTDLQTLRDATEDVSMTRHGISSELGLRIREITRKEIGRLHSSRKWITDQ